MCIYLKNEDRRKEEKKKKKKNKYKLDFDCFFWCDFSPFRWIVTPIVHTVTAKLPHPIYC